MQTLLIQVLAAQHRCRQCRAADAGIRIIDDAAEMMRQQGITAVQQGRGIVIEREDEALLIDNDHAQRRGIEQAPSAFGSTAPRNQVAQPRPQLVRQDGLGHIVVNAEVKQLDAPAGIIESRHRQNRHPALR